MWLRRRYYHLRRATEGPHPLLQLSGLHGKSHGLPSQVMWRKQPEDVQHLGISVTPVVAQAQLGVGLDTQELNRTSVQWSKLSYLIAIRRG